MTSQIQLIKNSEYQIMPWKNGLGSTAQIDIFPRGASFPDGDFLWRVSSATVAASSPFSQFPGCDRWLVVLKGAGLVLSGQKLLPMQPLHFQGETSIQCDLINETVLDLGVIYPRDRVKAKMSVQDLKAGDKVEVSGIGYVYCVLGNLQCGDIQAGVSDSLFFDRDAHGAINANSDAQIVRVDLSVMR